MIPRRAENPHELRYTRTERQGHVGRAGGRLHHTHTHPEPGDPACAGAKRRARPRADRHGQDRVLRAAHADAARTGPRPRAHAAHADPGADARARLAGAGQLCPLRREPQAEPRAPHRRRLLRRAGQDHHPRGGRADRDARPPARPFRARAPAPFRRRDPRHRRSRPHARHGLHPRHRADREAASLHPADALFLRHDAARDHATGGPLPAQSRARRSVEARLHRREHRSAAGPLRRQAA